MTDLHKHYDQLTSGERRFVDAVFQDAFKRSRVRGIPLCGDDRAEVVVDALSKLVLESRRLKRSPKEAA